MTNSDVRNDSQKFWSNNTKIELELVQFVRYLYDHYNIKRKCLLLI